MKTALIAAAAILLVPITSAQPVEVTVEHASAPSCATPAPAPCVAGHDPADSRHAGDDTVYLQQHVDGVSVRANTANTSGLIVRIDLSSSAVEHGAGPRADTALDLAHQYYPSLAAAWLDVWLEPGEFWIRRPHYYPGTGAVGPYDAGSAYDHDYFNDTHLHAPYTTPEGEQDLDEWLVHDQCKLVNPTVSASACPIVAKREDVRTAVPNVVFGARVLAIEVRVNNPDDPGFPQPVTRAGRGESRTLAPSASDFAEVEAHIARSARFLVGGTIEPRPEDETMPREHASVGVAASGGAIEHAEHATWWPVAAGSAAGLLALIAAGLYHRLRKTTLLENATRRRVYETIVATPGIRVRTIAKELGVDYSTVEHHVWLLRKFHFVEHCGDGQARLFARGGQLATSQQAAVVAASAPSTRAILEYLEAHGSSEVRTLRAALQLPPSTTVYALSRLVNAGLVTRRVENGRLVAALSRQ